MNASEKLQLNCPKCNGTLRVSTNSAGKRVRCPRCQAAFKVPGHVAVERDDDDWLNLDAAEKEPRTEPPASPQHGGSGAPDTTGETPPFPPPEEDDELDPFMLKSEELPPPPGPKNQPPAKPRSGTGFSDADLQALNSFLKEPSDVAGTSSGENDSGSDELVGDLLDEKDVVSEFRVTCPVCSSLTYARTDQVGKQLKCSDCYTMMTVPPPPKIKKAYNPDIENAETYAMVDSGEPGPSYEGSMTRSAADLLRDAEEDSDGKPEERDEYDNPDVKKWFSNTFGILLDPGVIIHFVILLLLAALLGAAVPMMGSYVLAVASVLSLFYFLFVLACAVSILESVSNGEKRVSDWSYTHPGEWFGPIATVVAAGCLAGGPAALVGSMLFGLLSMGTIAITMFSLYIFFPFVLLSMLDSGSILMPFSSEVSKSVARCQEDWGVLYFSAGLLFLGLLIFYIVLSLLPAAISTGLAFLGTVVAVFIYFSMIGRLAYAIGHAFNAPPLKNDIDKVRARERAERNG